jgi:probable HAF family extracellular repeat protein
MKRILCLFSATWILIIAHVAGAQTLSFIDVPGAYVTVAIGINDRSQIVGFFEDATGLHGFVRSNGQFTTLDVPNAYDTRATGINSQGQVVGRYAMAGQPSHGFLLENGRFVTIDPPGATSASASGINDLGQIVGSYSDASGSHGFLWTHGQFVTLNGPQAVPSGSSAFAINRSGQIVGGYFDGGGMAHGFRLEAAGDITTFATNRDFSTAGINDRGEIVGSEGRDCERAVLLAFGVFSLIPGVQGVQVCSAGIGINNRGQIVGRYTQQNQGPIGSTHGYLLTPANEVADVSGLPSPSGTRVPVASIIVDDHLSVWTLGPGEEILRDGMQAAGGYGSQIQWFQDAIYVLGDDSNWWKWTGSTWVFAGAQDPSS